MKKLLTLVCCCLIATIVTARQLAFPGAEGFGAYAVGGRHGEVVHVTNLKANGEGSLADAVSKPNRIVVFDVGGVIDITGGSITIAKKIEYKIKQFKSKKVIISIIESGEIKFDQQLNLSW